MSADKETREWDISFGEERDMRGTRTWLSLYLRNRPGSEEKLTESWIGGSCDRIRQKYANTFRDMFKEAFQDVFTDEEKKEKWWNTDRDFNLPNSRLFLRSGAITRDKEELGKIEKNFLEVFKKTFPNY